MYSYRLSSHPGEKGQKTDIERRRKRKTRLIALATEGYSILPSYAYELLILLKGPVVNLTLIKQIVGNHPSLSSQFQRLCNAALFGQDQDVLGVNEAFVLLGCDRLKTIVLTCSLMAFTRKWLSQENMRRFWQHSILTALFSDRIARWLGHLDGNQPYEHVYLGGLIHDVGMLPLLIVAAEENAGCKSPWALSCGSSLDEEKDYFGLDHCDVAQLMGPFWDFFPACSDIIAYHHRPDRALNNRHLVGIVGAADIICETLCVKLACAAESREVMNSSSRDDLFALCLPDMETNERLDLIETIETEFLHLLPLFAFDI